MKSFLFKLENILLKFEKIILFILIFLMILLSFYQFILRIFFNSGIIWMDSFLRYLVLITAMFSASIVTYYQKHFAMDAIFNFINIKWHKILKKISNIFVIIILILFIISSIKFLNDEIIYKSEAFTIKNFVVRAYIFELSLPLGFLFMLFHSFMNFFREKE